MRRTRLVRLTFLGVLAVLASACGGEARSTEPVVTVKAPVEPSRVAAVQTLEPVPTPAPTPTPPPETPTPVPPPTATPLPPPEGATVTSAAGTQAGSVSPYCWSGGGRCRSADPPPAAPLLVRQGETVLLRIAAARVPSEETIRPFQGTRSDYPSKSIDPALETELAVDLVPGDWSMDLCATWHGAGQPVCWLFSLRVEASGP